MAPTIVLTRSREENERIAPEFHRRGLRTVSVPMIELRRLDLDPVGFRGANTLSGDEPVLLTSAAAAEIWLDLRDGAFADLRPSGYVLVGERSADLVRMRDPAVPVRAVAQRGEELLSPVMAPLFDGVGRIVYPCSSSRRDPLVDGLRGRGIDVCELPLYVPEIPDGTAQLLRSVLEKTPGRLLFLFFSPSAVSNFFETLPVPSGRAIFGAIGPTTAEALREHGVTDSILSPAPNLAAYIEILTASLN